MQSWPERVEFRQPLRDARVVATRGVVEEAEIRQRERDHAAYERGRREGEEALGVQLVRQRGELLELQNGVLDSLQQIIPRLSGECERELIGLAIEVAQKLVAGLPISAEMVETVVREALAQVEESAGFTIHLHPEDLALLEKVNSPLLLPRGGMDRVNFQAADTVSRGGCLVHTRFGTIDARRETKIELLQKAMFS